MFDSNVGEGLIIQPGLSLTSSKLNFSDKKAAKNIKVVVLNNLKTAAGETSVSVQCLGAESAHIKHYNADHRALLTGEELERAGVDLVLATRGLESRLRQEIRRSNLAAVEHIGEQVRQRSNVGEVRIGTNRTLRFCDFKRLIDLADNESESCLIIYIGLNKFHHSCLYIKITMVTFLI